MKEGIWLVIICLLFIIIALLGVMDWAKKRSDDALSQQVIFDNRIYICKEVKQTFSDNDYTIGCKPVH